MPFEASLAGLRVEVLHAQVVPADLAAALNGAVVGLAAAAAAPSDGDNEAVAAAASQQPRECLGLGLVRAVDARRQALYLLTDVPAEQLSRVEVLTLGKLELPDRLLEGRGAASPYQGLFCLTSTATGAGQIKSRNNLLRASRMGAGLR
jgi:polynucleotide 5'-hydroxyl-kinase GRC3/NOL9